MQGFFIGVDTGKHATQEVAKGDEIRYLPFYGGEKFHCVSVLKKRM